MGTFRLIAALAITAPLLLTGQNVASKGMADELMDALKSCGADAKTMKAAQDMIKKSKGMPSEDAIDDFIDSIDSDKLADCVDDAL